jgi:hypothetical protein
VAPIKRISKRAQHKLDVEGRKTLPFVKRRKARKYKLPFPTDFFAMAREQEREGVLMTRVNRVPARFFLEHEDANGEVIQGALQAKPKGQRGYTLLLEGGGIHEFKTQRRALKFFASLQYVPCDDDCETNNKGCVTHNRRHRGDIHTDKQGAGVPDTGAERAVDDGSSQD